MEEREKEEDGGMVPEGVGMGVCWVLMASIHCSAVCRSGAAKK
jgi:hypothetical protein